MVHQAFSWCGIPGAFLNNWLGMWWLMMNFADSKKEIWITLVAWWKLKSSLVTSSNSLCTLWSNISYVTLLSPRGLNIHIRTGCAKARVRPVSETIAWTPKLCALPLCMLAPSTLQCTAVLFPGLSILHYSQYTYAFWVCYIMNEFNMAGKERDIRLPRLYW